MYLIKKQKNETLSIACQELSPQQLKACTSLLAQKILKKLAETPNYPKDIASQLNIHEQKVYYHTRKLEKAGIIQRISTETKQGALAHIYSLTHPSFAVRFKDFQTAAKAVSFA